MRASLSLRTEPTVRQTEAILQRVEKSLAERGIPSSRLGPGRLHFRMPGVWRAPRAGVLHAVTSGAALVSAGAGEARQVRIELSYTGLRFTVVLLTAMIVVAGLGWPRLTLINAVLLLWLLAFGAPYMLAARAFRRIVRDAAREVVERRKSPRGTEVSAAEDGAADATDRSPPSG